jgi:hypothetical protein
MTQIRADFEVKNPKMFLGVLGGFAASLSPSAGREVLLFSPLAGFGPILGDPPPVFIKNNCWTAK